MTIEMPAAVLELLSVNATELASRERDGDEAWHEARSGGGKAVTATEAARLVTGGVKTRREILESKVSGGSFGGNLHTERGRRREFILAEFAYRRFGIIPNSSVWASRVYEMHRATPDGVGVNWDGLVLVGEYKSTTGDWSASVPRVYIDQVLWQIWVMGADHGVLVWEQVDEFGQPYSLEPNVVIVHRDEMRIAQLVSAVREYLDWVEAGAPAIDVDIDEELDEALTRKVKWAALRLEAEKEEAAAAAIVRAKVEERGKDKPWIVSGTRGEFNYTVKHKLPEVVVTFDQERFRRDHPQLARKFSDSVLVVDDIRELRPDLFEEYGSVEMVPVEPTTRLTIKAQKQGSE